MNKMWEHGISVVLVMILLLSGCAPTYPVMDGQVLELGARATQLGLQKAMAGASGTHVITDGKLIFALWHVDGLWAGACVNCGVSDPIKQFNQLTDGKGMVMNYRTASQIVDYLTKEHGWKSVPASALGGLETIKGLLSQVATFTGFLVIPAGVITDEFKLPKT